MTRDETELWAWARQAWDAGMGIDEIAATIGRTRSTIYTRACCDHWAKRKGRATPRTGRSRPQEYQARVQRDRAKQRQRLFTGPRNRARPLEWRCPECGRRCRREARCQHIMGWEVEDVVEEKADNLEEEDAS
jgi:hypothetical protein